MKKSIVNKLSLIIVLVALSSCKVRKAATVISSPKTQVKVDQSKKDVLKKLVDNQVNFNTIQLKAKADLTIGDKNHDVNMNIRMQKDKVIWVSVNAAIIGEVARTLITPDSIKILNRFDNTYTKKPFSYIHQFASKQVTFKTLQDLFIGNPLSGTLTESATVDNNASQLVLKGILADLAYTLIYNANSNLIQSNLSDKRTSQSLTLNYGEYGGFGGQAIPQLVDIKSVADNKNISINLKYTYVGINETVEFPFSIPKRFTVIK